MGRAHFGSLAEVAYQQALAALGGPEEPRVACGQLLPPDDPEVLTRSNFYKELFAEYAEENKTPLRLQKEFSYHASSTPLKTSRKKPKART